MSNFWVDLAVNSIGGLVAAIVFALIVWLWERRKQSILGELIEIMGRAIEIRNLGERKKFKDRDSWLQQAQAIWEEARAKAKELSPTAGALVQWLDRVDPWDSTDEVKRSVSILSKTIERIRGLMERNS